MLALPWGMCVERGGDVCMCTCVEGGKRVHVHVRGGGGACMGVAGCVSAIYLASLHFSFLRILPARHGHSQLPFVIPP